MEDVLWIAPFCSHLWLSTVLRSMVQSCGANIHAGASFTFVIFSIITSGQWSFCMQAPKNAVELPRCWEPFGRPILVDEPLGSICRCLRYGPANERADKSLFLERRHRCAWRGSAETHLADTLHRYAITFVDRRQAPGARLKAHGVWYAS